jgi:hypothetical protein
MNLAEWNSSQTLDMVENASNIKNTLAYIDQGCKLRVKKVILDVSLSTKAVVTNRLSLLFHQRFDPLIFLAPGHSVDLTLCQMPFGPPISSPF